MPEIAFTPPIRLANVRKRGFTLIELSIVLVIIGLIVGGVLMGRDLIRASEVRAVISQVEQFNAAANAFRGKYGGLPGDLSLTQAVQYNFVTTACDGTQGKRDGNGLIDGNASSTAPWLQTMNETGLFWQDLSQAKLIPNGIGPVVCGTAVEIGYAAGDPPLTSYLPVARTGGNNFFYVYEINGANYFGLGNITQVNVVGNMGVGTSFSVAEAYSIDAKMDDGLPITGNVTSSIVQNGVSWYTIMSTTDTATSCAHYYQNSVFNPGYSITYNNGNGANCALSFKMQ